MASANCMSASSLINMHSLAWVSVWPSTPLTWLMSAGNVTADNKAFESFNKRAAWFFNEVNSLKGTLRSADKCCKSISLSRYSALPKLLKRFSRVTWSIPLCSLLVSKLVDWRTKCFAAIGDILTVVVCFLETISVRTVRLNGLPASPEKHRVKGNLSILRYWILSLTRSLISFFSW